ELNKPVEENYGTMILDGLPAAESYATLLDQLKMIPFMQKELQYKGVIPAGNRLNDIGLKKFIEFLEDEVRRADDIVDFGFVRIQTDLYRHRQLMLGSIDASRLATSPALAAIAKGETALATKEEIINYLHAASETQSSGKKLRSGSAASGSGDTGAIASRTMSGSPAANESNLADRHAAGEHLTEATRSGGGSFSNFDNSLFLMNVGVAAGA